MTEMSFFRDQEIARRVERQHRQNRGRLATTRAVFDTFGWGSFEFEDSADFDCIYIEQPTLSIGHHIEVDEWLDALQRSGLARDQPSSDGGDTATMLPTVTGFVTAWERDDNGHYVGAYCAAMVHFPQLTLGPTGLLEPVISAELSFDNQPEIHHHFRFEGVALKSAGDTGNAENGSASS